MSLRIALIAAALVCAGARAQTSPNPEAPSRPSPQDPGDATHERSSTLNNSANRASDPTHGENDAFNQVPGGPATPKKDWKKGDPRGRPQKPKVSKKHVQEKLKKQQEATK